MANRLAARARPGRVCLMHQEWRELLFLHWSMDTEIIQRLLPDSLRVDTFDGKAWVGVVPFFMQGVRPRFLPPVPGISNFLELNLRTYVVDRRGRPGVWFFSLDTGHRLPVWIARRFFHLPYCYAHMRADVTAGGIDYRSSRILETGEDMEQVFKWQREGAGEESIPGSLEFFLIERYRLFAHDSHRDRLFSGQVHHEPYRYSTVKLEAYSTRLFHLNGLPEPEGLPESAIASAGAGVSIHALERVS